MMKEVFDIQNLVRENVKGLKPYASARDEYVSNGAKMIFLDANENPFDNGVNRYPDPHQRNLMAVLAEKKGIRTENLLLGNGSDEVLDLIFRAFCEPKQDNVITLPPTYGMYQVLAGVNNIENREVLLTEDFQPDVDGILKMADKNSKIVFLCSPNNPTGNRFDGNSIERLLQNFPGLVAVDEAYIDFSERPSIVRHLGAYPNLIVIQTLSKAYGMAGIRLGICIASKEIIAILQKIKPPYNINELTQQRASERMQEYDQVQSEVSRILQERQLLETALHEINFVSKVYPSDANFILVKVDDANKRYRQLIEKGVVVRNRTSQPRCENTLRFTVGTKQETTSLIRILNELT
jgi:histidinol-phosphate aminotransferase